MATLQKIRNKGGLLIAIIIGLALLAFILGDFLKKGPSSFSSSEYELAEISGNSIPYQLYQQKLEELIENTKRNSGSENIDEATMETIREQAWESILRENVMDAEYEKLGLGISSDELFDIVQGNNIHPQVQQIPIFKNQETGQFDRALVIRFLKNLDQDESGLARSSWLAFEEALAQTQVMDKYNTLIKKGLYVTKDQAMAELNERNIKSNVAFVVEKYTTISDSAVSVTDQELKAYYDKNSYKYEQEAERVVEYVIFEVKPSKEDFEEADKWINSIKPDFIETADDKQFVNLNSDVAFVDKYYKQGELTEQLDTVLFNAEIGATYGPYFEGNSYKIAKLAEVKMLSDTVKARHILIRPDQNTGDYSKAKATIDSLKTLVENGANFEELAMKYGSDGTAAEGGDLGWFKREDMVAPFNDSCFFAKVGDIKTAVTQFGVHLIKVEGKGPETKKVQVAVLERVVAPSQKTYDVFYGEASQFAGLNNTYDKFDKAINEKALAKRVTPPLKETDKTIAGLEAPREIVRWAYNTATKGSVSDVFELGNKFVVATLTEVKEKGIAPFEQIKEELTVEVKKEKKAKTIIDKFNSAMTTSKNIQDIAANLGLRVDTAENVSFSSFSMPGIGVEPKVIVNAVELEKDKLSAPVQGNTGVYLLHVFGKTENTETETKAEAARLTSGTQSRVDYEVYEALKKVADIKDYRIKFF
ncbi:MAG TPA: hypothetical protein DDX39_07040 [Bacteroidales bacterium]|nr:MAG: hypothetical protein A2W98_12235 [Bacteroidetes bacterium GWF2_33_38]OFY73894.1 MAG: hypothetical protein A2265_11560 [Bacteroidetes bacterium RIFOXYA12_FULL_33_9]OFY87027.1 MAG: hypothetical protein A2236_12195 [Bacteroidetes bacterium RIFOXYA2_FULL_33_7]HBF88384.1 hypothetical protein [Bacteroidales bacterium]